MSDTLPYKVVWIASVPRTGSMWAFNVARELLRESGKTVEPDRVQTDNEETLQQGSRGFFDPDPNRIWVLKLHKKLRMPLPRSRLIVTHRDPRDSVISFMRFMRLDFDEALGSISAAWLLESYYRTASSDVTLHIAYTDIVERPDSVACSIARFLGLSDRNTAAVVAKFDKASVAELIMAMHRAPGPRIGHRRIDLQSGFQSGHVSDYRDGDWRRILTPDQLERMHAALGVWVREAGYQE